MTPGDIAITAIPQADGKTKLRPLAVLSEFPRHGDLLVCGITSQMWNFTEGFDVALRKGEPDFEKSGLKRDSIFRMGHLTVLSRSKVSGSIGKISDELLNKLIANLMSHLAKSLR
jgi:mRNA-degrading endonuclease toxin of MazEF toxin-antitoxin module